MNAETIARTIQTILAPVVMISACALFLSGHQGRYVAVTHRLREMVHERLALLHDRENTSTFTFESERLWHIERQIPELLHQHKGIHDSIMAIYSAIMIFIVCMFAIAVAAVQHSTRMGEVSLVLFLAGTGVLLLAMVQGALAFRTAHRGIHYEVRQTCGLDKRR